MIDQSAQDGGRAVVIIGSSHATPVAGALSDNLEAEVISPAYSRFSIAHLKEFAYPIIVSYSILYIAYSGLLAYMRFFL